MEESQTEDALYAEPPGGFVVARDALVRQLRAAGDRAGAARVRALRRPTRAAWAVNVAVRERPEAAQELSAAARDLGDAQRELLAGGDRSRLRDAQARADAACDALVAAAPVTDPATLEAVRQTFRAATVDADALAEVTSGRLLRERVASGFGDLGGFLPPPGPPPPAAAKRAGQEAEKLAAKEAAEARAAEEAENLAAQEAAKARAAEEAERRAAAARRARIEQAREDEAAAATAVGAARRALAEAEAILASRRAASDAADARLADAVHAREQAERD